jgi:hypothetical protein
LNTANKRIHHLSDILKLTNLVLSYVKYSIFLHGGNIFSYPHQHRQEFVFRVITPPFVLLNRVLFNPPRFTLPHTSSHKPLEAVGVGQEYYFSWVGEEVDYPIMEPMIILLVSKLHHPLLS